jgi:hypothetical protein
MWLLRLFLFRLVNFIEDVGNIAQNQYARRVAQDADLRLDRINDLLIAALLLGLP